MGMDWNTAPLGELIDHIISTHREYLKLELPRIAQRLQQVVQVHGAADAATLHQLADVCEGLRHSP